LDLADSDKKVLRGVERFRFFWGLAQRRWATFLSVSKTFSTKRFPRNTEHVIGEVSGRGMCWGVGSSKYDFLLGMLLGTHIMEF
jgi:hypothetical protein